MSSRDNVMKGQTSAMLSAERVVWSAWTRMGDKEVAREAAAKGLHLSLARIFLSKRLKLNETETRQWMVDEILRWVSELLKRRQVYKASHILSNMELDVGEEIMKIFKATRNKDLRDYLGNHLISIKKMDNKTSCCWHLLTNIINNNIFINEEHQNLNLNYIIEMNDELQSKIGSELYFMIYDESLEYFLKSKYMWSSLLKLNKPDLIIFWIDSQFGDDNSIITDNIDPMILEKLRAIFKLHSITPDLVNMISNNELSIPIATQEIVLNGLSKFGIFCEVEENNLLCIIKRLIATDSLEEIDHILSGTHCSINNRDFNNLVTQYCLENNLFTLLNAFSFQHDIDNILTSKEVQLIISCRELAKNFNDTDILAKNIYDVNNYLTDFNYNLSLLSLFVLNNDSTLMDIFSHKTVTIKGNQLELKSEDTIGNCLNEFPCLKLVDDWRKGNKPIRNASVTVYDLLERHTNMDFSQIFAFRNDPNEEMMHFKQDKVVKAYGYKKTVNFLFYLKQCRPSVSAKVYLCGNIKGLNVISNETAIDKTHELALRHFANKDIAASCVTFLELLEVSSDRLRLHLKIASALFDDGKRLSKNDVIKLFANINSDNQAIILNTLEQCTEEKYEEAFAVGELSDKQMVTMLQDHSLACQFSRLHNMKLPEKLLSALAKRDMWLPFLLCAQLYDYPPDQVKRLTFNFSNTNLWEHISHSIAYDTVIQAKREMLMKERDSRTSFLSRIGVRQQRENYGSSSSDGMCSSISSGTSYGSSGSNGSNCNSDASDNERFDSTNNSNCKANLLQVMITCHNSSDPPKALLQACEQYKNPLLAIFAASYEPDSVVVNWLTWLIVSCDFKLPNENLTCEIIALNANLVSEIMMIILKQGYFKTLLYSFQIFLADNPLNTIAEFLRDCIDARKCDVPQLKSTLDRFRKQLNRTSSNCIVITTDHEMSYINNKVWLENQALIFISILLQYYIKSRHDQIKTIILFCRLELEKFFTVNCPKFENVLQLLQCLERTGIEADLSVLHDNAQHKRKVSDYIDELLKRNMYETSFALAKLEDISPDNILIQQWSYKLNNFKGDFHVFWNESYKTFVNSNVSPKSIVKFYTTATENVTNLHERYAILKHAYEYAIKHRMIEMHKIERDMWITLLAIDDETMRFESDASESSVTFYADMIVKLNAIEIEPCQLQAQTLAKLDKAIGDMLDKGDVFEALKLERLFDRRHADLEIVKLMYSLAERLKLPYQLTADERLLVSKKAKSNRSVSRRRNFLSHVSNISMGSYTSGNTSVIYIPDNNFESPAQDTLAILEALIQHVNNGIDVAQRVLMLYRISVNIEKEYHEIVTISKNAMNVLKEALENDCRNKFEVVHDFLTVYKWTKEEIAQFVCSEIQSAVMNCASANVGPIILWDSNLNADFGQVLQLLPDDCTNLGIKLYTYANSLYKYQTESEENCDATTLSVIVELLILAHKCFSADCNTENITLVLKKCQTVISILRRVECWRLMVRLLTGIGRYTEMSYVFQILDENEKLDCLLLRESQTTKDGALKVALLDYIKKFCPDNEELYKAVALRFSLFSEVAQLWEREAETYVRTLIEVSKIEMQNNKLNPDVEPFVLIPCDDSTKSTLNRAMINYNRAAEYHLLGDKLTKAQNSAKQAELVALQISLLSRKENVATCILNLKQPQLNYLITNKLSFPQSRILVESYGCPIDWSSPLFEQYVVRNRTEYLKDFVAYLPLNDNLIHSISRKYINYRHTTDTATNNMKHILQTLSSIHVKYKLASELGFLDIVEEILEGNQLSYLKDTVWKRGFKDN